MKIYLVGGAIRDRLLNLPIKERDWVVVGATVDDMLQKGFRPVGKDFPVFLHPMTKEEYALARTERKVRRGYTGFEFDSSPHVTLEEDLKRRDLTINAIAEAPDGHLIDPFHGQIDLQQKFLRHVSEAFVEDPVRILRVARFAARFADLGFIVASETNELMKEMVKSHEVDALVAERVWKELERALKEKQPKQFFQVLADCNALPVLFPQIGIDTKGMNALVKAARNVPDAQIRFAALMYDISEIEIKQMCERYRVPSDYRDLACLVSKYHPIYKNIQTASAKDVVNLFINIDAFRREERFKKFLAAVAVTTENNYTDWLLQCYRAAKSININELLNKGLKGKELAGSIIEKRIEAVENLR